MEINRENKTITITQNTGITVSIALILMFAGAIFTTATWVADMRNRVSALENTTNTQSTYITKLQADSTTSQVKFTEIQTQLKSIDTTLVEIKERLQ